MVENGMPQLPHSAPLPGAETVQAPAMPQPPPQPIGQKHIEVVAVGVGFYDNHRKAVNDRFTVPKIEQLGSWMKCVDPKLQREHLARLEAKRQKANTAED